MAEAQERPPSCRDLVGLLAQNDRRSAYAALALGATTLEQVAERTGLRPAAAAMALQKLVGDWPPATTRRKARTCFSTTLSASPCVRRYG
ncbi:hypothetical protein ACFU7T_14455 [Streptomyces sp. NPDC057555]|uniref:hypothetical protein n=1 Tax=Streptomyces sp. NPDC057555 TaxID=3346166 RepID=UPI003682DA0E